MPRKGQKIRVAQDKSETVAELPLACVDERAAVEFLEKKFWGDCPACRHCGSVNVYQMKDATTGERNRRFLWRCHDCKKQFTIRVGTVLEDSRIPLRIWCYAFWQACASKKGVSALQIKRVTGLSYKSALFLMHRIRWAMADDHSTPPKMTGTVEADETYVGGYRRRNMDRRLPGEKPATGRSLEHKTPVFACVERGGKVRTRVLPDVTGANLRAAVFDNIDPSAHLMTDDWKGYRKIGREFASHSRVRHNIKEYVNPENPNIHTNTIEGFFSLLKRGIIGVYHNVSKKHLHRYCSEFEYRYNTRDVDDGDRTSMAIKKAEGKRLRYREPTKTAC